MRSFIIDLANRHEYTITIRASKNELMELGKNYNKIYNLLLSMGREEYAKHISNILNALDVFINDKEADNAETDDRK